MIDPLARHLNGHDKCAQCPAKSILQTSAVVAPVPVPRANIKTRNHQTFQHLKNYAVIVCTIILATYTYIQSCY